MAFGKLKGFLGVENEDSNENIGDDEYYNDVEDTTDEKSGSGNKMILLEPRAYSESQQIADYLKRRNTVVVNLKRVTPEQAKRIVDFLSGALYAISGDMQKLGGGIFLCTPNNVDVEGKISDDSTLKSSKGRTKTSDDNAEGFNW